MPTEALQKAREAEKHLAANAPDRAIDILRELDKSYPGQPAISLRLAQIYDTLNKNGYALFYYRRYVSQAGNKARPLAVERVSTLELMAGVNQQVEKVEKELGEDTRPVATPAPKVERMLATTAKDGSLVPIRNEKDFEKLQREGVPRTSPVTPIPTAASTPIVLPPAPTPAPAVPEKTQTASSTVQRDTGSRAAAGTQAKAPSESRGRVTISSAETPRPPDEDALLAEAFRKADSPESISTKTTSDAGQQAGIPQSSAASSVPASAGADGAGGSNESNQNEHPALDLAALSTPTPRVAVAPPGTASPSRPVSPRLTPSAPDSRIAFTKATPAYSSSRAASFFNVTPAQGQYALVSVMNEIPGSVLTLSITPRDDGEVASAILASKEQKRVYVRPGTYDVSATVATTDYSPITLMSTHFEYTFSAGQQYTRRFNKQNIQQIN